MKMFHTHVSEEAISNSIKVLKSTLLSEGPMVKTFEGRLRQDLGLSRPVALNSGTTALHLALVVAGVGSGDEVVLPAQTFIATGMVILAQSATPVFCDIDPDSGNMCVNSLRKKITPRTRAVIPVHWGGYPCDLEEINSVAHEAGLAVIEDAAHALGAEYRGRPIGCISRFSAFSFQAIKHVTTGDGGALCCLGELDEQDARIRRWFAIDRENAHPSILGERVYDADRIGYKYHMNDLCAAIGLGNLESFGSIKSRLRILAGRYREQLSGVDGLRLLKSEPDRVSGHWLFTIRVSRREDFIRALASRGVPASVVHLRIDRNRVFGGQRHHLPGQELFDEEQVSIPLHMGISDEDAELVVASIRAGW